MKKLLPVMLFVLVGCASTLDKEALRRLDHTGQDMAGEYLDAIKAGSLADPAGTRADKAEAFKSALRQAAINAGNDDLSPIE